MFARLTANASQPVDYGVLSSYAKFCNENAAQVLHLNERMQEAKKLLSSVQVMFDKTEDINFMKVRQAAHARVGRGLWRGLVVWEELDRRGVWWGAGWGH